ncbi:ParB N-terminal domain-containing protein [Cognatishimia sp. WU-CL00825]|uniref:ParB/RepB/Spo0J family partition protein n=1 Tax=Cognatishimia sp. WU-CL00825 TaxID=3127658 RepID=UPI0031039AD9
MAKRKRLNPSIVTFANPAVEPLAEAAAAEVLGRRAPIADVASDAAAMAAMEEMSQELEDARKNGRMIQNIALKNITLDHLVRDRVVVDDAEMQALMDSIRDRGQQTPIEVVATGLGFYGLISGWRRCEAIRQLQELGEGPETVQALLRRPETASDAYLAMVEENEIRVGLSYFERARIAAKSVEQGVFETSKKALLSLFRSASRTKRSKIRSFLTVVEALDDVLTFPQAIGERMGLMLAKQLDEDADFAPELRRQLTAAKAQTPEAEQEVLMAALQRATPAAPAKKSESKQAKFTDDELRPGLTLRSYAAGDRLELSGKALTPKLRAALLEWLKDQS